MYFPTKVISTHCEDKPWISPYLKSLIMKRQKTFLNGNLNLWRSLRNKVSRLIKIAKQTFYDGSVSRLKKSNPRQWHQQIKRMSGHNTHQNLSLPGSSPLDITNEINRMIYFCSQWPSFPQYHLPACISPRTVPSPLTNSSGCVQQFEVSETQQEWGSRLYPSPFNQGILIWTMFSLKAIPQHW